MSPIPSLPDIRRDESRSPIECLRGGGGGEEDEARERRREGVVDEDVERRLEERGGGGRLGDAVAVEVGEVGVESFCVAQRPAFVSAEAYTEHASERARACICACTHALIFVCKLCPLIYR